MTARRSDSWDFFAYTAALRRRWKLVLLCLIAVPAVSIGLASRQQKQYSATAVVLFQDPGFSQALFGSTVLPSSSDPTREAATNVRLIGLSTVAADTARVLNRSENYVSSEVTVSAQGDSDLVSVSATDASPAGAARLANAYANQYVSSRRNADRRTILAAAQEVRSQLNFSAATGAERSQLQREQVQLQVLAGLQTGNAEVVQTARTPTSPSQPQIKRDGVIAGIVGLLIGLALALLMDRLDRRVRDPEEAQAIFDRPILAYIPESQQFRRAGKPLHGAEAEAFSMLRTSLLYFNVDSDIRSLLIASAVPREGKTTVAWNLAAAVAAAGREVLLIEADLRQATLASRQRHVSVGPEFGLSQVLAGTLDPEDVTARIPLSGASGIPLSDPSGIPLSNPGGEDNDDDGPAVHVIFSGPIPPNPADLVESQRMRGLIQAAEGRYDLVVIDSPPTYVVTDALPLVSLVDGVIVVTRIGKVSRDASRHLRDQLTNLNANTLGLVINGAEQRRERYSYYWYSSDTNGKTKVRGRRRRSTA